MTGNGRLVLRGDVVWRESDGAVVVLDTRSSLYLTVGGTGPILWPLLVDGTTESELAALLVRTFAIDTSVATADVDNFLGGLRANDLLDS